MAKSRAPKIITKKHLARIERERLQRRYILGGSIIIAIIVFGLIVYGILEQKVLTPLQPVAIVGKEKITTRDFQARVRFERYQLISQYANLYETMATFGNDPNTMAFFQQQLNQIQYQLDPETMGQEVLDALIDDIIIRQEADRLGITVTKEEIDILIQEKMGYFPSGERPTSTPNPTTAPTSTLSVQQLTLIPPTATPTETAIPTIEQTSTVTATIIPATATPTNTSTPTMPVELVETPTPQPTATPYTYEAFQARYKEIVDELTKNLDFNENDLRKIIESEIYTQKIKEEITKDLLREQEQVWARHILVDNETLAQEIFSRLRQSEDFASLAAQYSQDESNKNSGGNLDWFGLGTMVPEFEKVAFNLAIGDVSEPVQTQFGWHIIQVLGHENRPLSASEYENMRENKLREWLDKQRQLISPKIFDYWMERVPTEPELPAELQVS